MNDNICFQCGKLIEPGSKLPSPRPSPAAYPNWICPLCGFDNVTVPASVGPFPALVSTGPFGPPLDAMLGTLMDFMKGTGERDRKRQEQHDREEEIDSQMLALRERQVIALESIADSLTNMATVDSLSFGETQARSIDQLREDIAAQMKPEEPRQ